MRTEWDLYIKRLGHYKSLIKFIIILWLLAQVWPHRLQPLMASTAKKEANIPGISIKQLLIPNSDFSPYTYAYTLKRFFW